ncbi:hypothetical protein KKG41_00605 [Patescibacteria group bacterium]|nr:hypothetical protein [Patescibacteria group bacterium]MBU1890088.1 hypothetical protein [Patescibacteria group bacterium]
MTFILTSLKIVAVDISWSIVYFPIWWYSSGLKMAALFVFRKISDAEQALAIGILLRYLFKPMYADYTKSGRAISLVVRIIHLCVLLVLFIVATIFYFTLFIVWLMLIPAVIYFIYLNAQVI